MTMRLFVLAVLAVWTLPSGLAQATTASRCIAFVEGPRRAMPAALPAAVAVPEVEITYVTHSTFRLRTAAGVVIATDYAGYFGAGAPPHVATMNHAHETHYTDYPDTAIKHVLRGWNPAGSGPAKHHLVLDDVLVRNVATDIRSWGGLVEPYGNSIFIFETADLCIGHLGHLHHMPTRDQFAQIGRLDIVFAAVDGGLTLDHPTMIAVLKELRASLVIPMHYFGRDTLQAFLVGMAAEFAIRVHDSATTTVTLPGLPRRPTVLVLPGY
jgi:L-ascorbate metabolism protein UlaG (beta-lactamase superfamily)